MKQNISQAELKALMGQKASLCLSLYLNLNKGKDFKQAKLQLKNYTKECEELLTPELDRATLETAFLAPLRDIASDQSWRLLKNGALVVFLAQGFQVVYNLPVPVTNQLYWGDRFHTLPLVKLNSSSTRFLLLSLSQHSVKLLKCSKFDCEELPLKDVPHSLDEFLKYDEAERGQAHAHSEVVTPFGRGTSVFYGNGDWKDSHKDKIKEFFKQVNKAVMKECHGMSSVDIPLILAGVGYIQGLYREENTYGHLLAQGISGNPELKQTQILKLAYDLVDQQFELLQDAEQLRYQNRLGAEHSVRGVEAIIKQAHLGKVDVLFLPQRQDQKAEDLFDLAANQTILHGGKVLLVDENKISGVSEGIALLRYAS